MKLLIKTSVKTNYKEVMKGFTLELFKALKPPLMSLNVDRFDGCLKGDEVHLSVGLGPIQKKWVSLITDNFENESEVTFVDEGKVLPFPLSSWKHIHRVQKIDDSSSEIHDDIEYSTGFVPLDYLMYPILYLQFAVRGPVYRKFFN